MARWIRTLFPTVYVALLLALAACGSSGPAFIPEPPPSNPVLDLGLQSSTVPSRVELPFANPLASDATITSGSASGPFLLDPADLPAAVGVGETVMLGVLFAPQGDGAATGTLVVVYDGTGGHEEETYSVRAVGETITWGLIPHELDFGALEVGQTADRDLTLVNASNMSPVTLSSAEMPFAFEILGSPFPIDLPPAGSTTITVRFAPLLAGVQDAVLRLGPHDVGGPVNVSLVAEALGAGSEVITSYGDVTLDSNGKTPLLSVSVPSDAISLFIEGVTDGGLLPDTIGLDTLTGPGGKVYENSSSTGAYVWLQGWDVFTAQIPNTDKSNVQLVSGGGTYKFRLKLMSGIANKMNVRAIVERRDSASIGNAVLPLNVWLAKGISPTAATAANNTRLQSILSRVDTILSQQGIRLGDIDYYDVSSSSYDEIYSESEFFDMLETTSSASKVRLNLFFVNVALGGGVVGVSAMIAGPKQNGTPSSGVMSVYEGFSTNTIGLIAAHELGHFLGLYHTVEQTGSHDFIDDTANCPASGTNTTCPTSGGGLLMHWQAVGGTTITDGQGLVVRGHPHMEPGAAGSTKRALLPAMLESEISPLSSDWCGTCRECLKQKGE